MAYFSSGIGRGCCTTPSTVALSKACQRALSLTVHSSPRSSSAPKTQEGATTFYWPASAKAGSFAHFRIAADAPESKRHVDDVCLEELSALALHLLHHAGSAPRQDVARSVCRLVGMSAATAPAVMRVSLGIDSLIGSGQVRQSDESIRVST